MVAVTRYLLLTLSSLMLASCAHVADLKSPTQIARDEKRKEAAEERRVKREARRMEREAQMQKDLEKQKQEQEQPAQPAPQVVP